MCRKWIVKVRLSTGRKIEEYCRSPGKSDEGSEPVIEMDIRNVDRLWDVFGKKSQ